MNDNFICTYITTPNNRSCWTRFSITLRAFTYPPFPRWDPEICDWARAEPGLLELCRAWANWTTLNKFRMTLGGTCYFYSHFGEANSILCIIVTAVTVISITIRFVDMRLPKTIGCDGSFMPCCRTILTYTPRFLHHDVNGFTLRCKRTYLSM